MTPLERRLARRIATQRARLRWYEALSLTWHSFWQHRALAYRRQLEDAGIKPEGFWSATYRSTGASRTLANEPRGGSIVPALQARIAELEAALLPFAEMADSYIDEKGSYVPLSKRGAIIQVSDLKTARDVLAKGKNK